VKLKCGRGTGIDADLSTVHVVLNLLATAPLEVKIAVPLPYGLALMISMASLRVSALRITRTGPKISCSWQPMPVFTSEMIVGPTKFPLEISYLR